MEFYKLTDFHIDKQTNSLHFLALAMQETRIVFGTDEMINTMLKDIGIVDHEVLSWSIEHFISDYLTGSWDFDRGIDDWGNYWEIRVTFRDQPNLDVASYKDIPSWADSREAGRPEEDFWQDNCVHILQFYTQADLEKAEQLLQYVERMRIGELTYHDIKKAMGWAFSKHLLPFKYAIETGALQQPIEFRRRYCDSLQLFLYCGKYDKSYYESDMEIYEDRPVPIHQQILTFVSGLDANSRLFDHENKILGLWDTFSKC